MSIKNDSATITWTEDSLFSGKIVCHQNKDGYRFSIDPILLSHFVDITKNDKILDLGTGCGIMLLIILYRHFDVVHHLCGVEVQKDLCELTEHNIKTNNFHKKARVVHGNVKAIRDYFTVESYDKVICNPPFFEIKSGRLNENKEARVARHEIEGNLYDFIDAASYCLKNRGCGYFVYPADKINYFLHSVTKARLEPKQLQFIYSYPGDDIEARLVLIKCVKNGKSGVKVLSPLFIYNNKNGKYSSAMQACYENNRIDYL